MVNYQLKNNSQIFIGKMNDNRLTVFLRDESFSSVLGKQVCIIPEVLLMREVSIERRNDPITRLIYVYRDEVTNCFSLNQIDIHLMNGRVDNQKQYKCKTLPQRILSETYVYQDMNDRIVIYSTYGSFICPQLFRNNQLKMGDVNINQVNIYDTISSYHDIHLEVSFCVNDVERIHTILKVPTREKEEFKISKYIWSEMSNNMEYCLPFNTNKEYAEFPRFWYTFSKSELAAEIICVSQYYKDIELFQRKKIREKIIDHVKK